LDNQSLVVEFILRVLDIVYTEARARSEVKINVKILIRKSVAILPIEAK